MSEMSHAARAPGSLLAAWSVFVRERFQLPALLVFGTAQAAAQYVVRARLDVGGLVIAVLGIAGLLSAMRLMDELKDLDKDRAAHPERPLPRGLLSERGARTGLWLCVTGLLLGAAAIAIGVGVLPGALFGLCVLYALLMYREFFAPTCLGGRPFLYAVTHQVIIVPIYAFATAAAVPTSTFTAPVLWFALTGLGAAFALELCRKLDPDAHPALGTYLTVSGPGWTFTAVTLAVVLAAVSAFQVGVHVFVWPAGAALLCGIVHVARHPERFKTVEGLAALFAFTQVLAPTLAQWTGVGA